MSEKCSGEKIEIWEKIKKGDQKLKEQYMQANLKLAHSICHKFVSNFYFVDYEDLFQEACIGLYKAIERFDPSCGTRFSTFAVPFILGEIRSYLRKQVKERYGVDGKHYLALKNFRQEYWQKHGQEPTIHVIADKTGIPPEEVVHLMDVFSRSFFVCDEETFASPDMVLLLKEIIAALPSRERRLFFLRFFKGLKQEELGKILKISQKHVSRLEAKIKEKLKDYLQS